jgi:hypothetical protein
MHLLSGLLKASNRRYMEFISTFDDVSAGIGNCNASTSALDLDFDFPENLQVFF